MISIPEKISIQSHSARKGSLGLPASSPQRISGITRKQPAKDLLDYPQATRKGSRGLPASSPQRDLWDYPQAGKCARKDSCSWVFPRLAFVGVLPGLSFAIDHAEWNIGFLSASVLIYGRNMIRTPASQAMPCC